jgi:hypothetical protein
MSDRKLKNLMMNKQRRKKALRIEKEMLRYFHSPIPAERLFMQRKMLEYAENDPELTIMVLLNNYQDKDIKVVNSVHDTLTDLAKNREAMSSLLEVILHPDRDIRRNVFHFLEERKEFHSITYVSFLEQTMVLVGMARKKGIPIEDIISLVDVSKDNYLDGRIIDAIKDIATCLDLVKHRIRSVEHLKNYLMDVLRMAPELTRIGVYSGNIETPLKRAIKASRTRTYDDTSKIVARRTMESTILNQLSWIGEELKDILEERPNMNPEEIWGTDVWLLTSVHELMDMVTSATIAREEENAFDILWTFLGEDFRDYYQEEMSTRVRERDPSAIFGLYIVGIVCLKLFSALLPEPAEDIYQKYFRRLEGDSSIHLVSWPEIVMRILVSE